MNKESRIAAELTQEQLHFLEDFERRCNDPDSPAISKVSIFRCLLRAFEELDIEMDLSGACTEDELLHQFLGAVRKARC